jgi:hypothetical protein
VAVLVDIIVVGEAARVVLLVSWGMSGVNHACCPGVIAGCDATDRQKLDRSGESDGLEVLQSLGKLTD